MFNSKLDIDKVGLGAPNSMLIPSSLICRASCFCVFALMSYAVLLRATGLGSWPCS